MNSVETSVELEIDNILFTDRQPVDVAEANQYRFLELGETISEAKVHHFTGYDNGRVSGGRRTRETATPNFDVEILTMDGDSDTYEAAIVVNNIPDNGNVKNGEPVAIAKVALTEDDTIDDTRWFMVILATGRGLTILPKLITYEGDPEELIEKIHLFEEE